jgi:hypothetical protein
MHHIVDTSAAAGSLKTVAEALAKAHLVGMLKRAGPSAVCAPADEALAKRPKAELDALKKDKATVTAVRTQHVVERELLGKDIQAGQGKTVQGSELTPAAFAARFEGDSVDRREKGGCAGQNQSCADDTQRQKTPVWGVKSNEHSCSRTETANEQSNQPKNRSYPARSSTGGGVGKVILPTMRWQM